MLSGLQGTQYRPLSEEQVLTIHDASLKILEKTGVTYEQGLLDTVNMLGKAGAKVGVDPARVTFPSALIEESVAKAPERVILYSRDGENDLDLTEHRVYLGTGGAAITILDLESGQARPTTLNDLYQLARLVESLDNIHFYLRPCVPTDIPVEAYDANVIYACLKGTAKHIMVGVNDIDGLHKVMDIAAMVADGEAALIEKPFVSITSCFAISPLKLCTHATSIMLESVRKRIPVALSSAPMSGSTAPMTMAGMLAQLHAEELAGITVCQLTNPGAPILYGGIPGMANMSSMAYSGGPIECGMMNAAIHQLSHHIKVPNYNSSGLTDSKAPDIQAGWEKAFTTLLAAMGGSNFVHHAAGMLESMLAVAYEQYVIDDEIIGSCCKALKGIEVDAERLALEVIDSVGPGGNYLMADHTMAHMRKEYYFRNGLSDRSSREKWETDGSRDAGTRAREMAKKILSKEETPYIPDDVDRAIREKYDILL